MKKLNTIKHKNPVESYIANFRVGIWTYSICFNVYLHSSQAHTCDLEYKGYV